MMRPVKKPTGVAPAGVPSGSGAARFMAVKQEISDAPKAGETDRQAKIRAMAAKIRAESRAKAGLAPEEPAAETEEAPVATAAVAAPGQAKRKPPAPAPAPVDHRKEEEDSRKLEAMLPVLEQKITAAEDEADKVSILAAPLAMETSEELRSVQSGAIRDTERAVKSALSAIALAKREVEKRLKEAENMAPVVRDSAKEEVGKLSERLETAQAKVEEHRNVRRDHEQALAAEKLFGELASRLGSVEIDCEKAAMMAEPLAKVLSTDPDTISAAEIRECKEALRIAQATLAPTSRLISGKVGGLKGPVRKKMQELQDRAEASQGVLDKAQQTVEEAQSRAAAVPILNQAAERIQKVEEVLTEMRESESPFLMGIEVMPADESVEVLQKMDKCAAAAQATIADAHKFIALKVVEIGRLAEGAASSARRELEKAKQQIDSGFERVKAFQEECAKRRRQNLVVTVKEKIEEAEAAVLKMKEASADLPHLDAATLPEALEQALAAELEAQNLVTAARRELQDKQQELRPHEGASADVLKNSSEMLRTKVRVNYMEAELGKFRKLAKNFEERIKVGKSLTDTSKLLEAAEADVEKLSEVAAAWPADERPPEDADKSIASVQSKLSSTTVQVEMKLQTAQGLELKELRGIFGRLQKAQGKLDSVKEAARQRTRAASSTIVRHAAEAVRRAEAKVATVSSSASANLPAEKLEALNAQAKEGLMLIAAAQTALTKGSGPALALESKVEFARLQLRCKALERKGKQAANYVLNKFEHVAKQAEQVALDALRLAARQDEDKYDANALFDQLAKEESHISEEQFCDFLASTEPPVPADRAKIAFRRIAPHGLGRRALASSLADLRSVTRDITLTDGFEIQSAKKIRKLAVGELLEATGAERDDESLGLLRVRCRVIRDGATGWVTVKSTGGATYLDRASKPYVWCAESMKLRVAIEDDSVVAQELQPGDVLELVEGPKEERIGSDARVRGVACHEEAVGWLQVSDKNGTQLAQISSNIYKCSEAIAMTDVADFASCTMVRRIEAGEALELLADESAVQPSEGGSRRKFRACRDNREGWITMQGSQGTVYVRPVQKHYVCLQATPMHTGLGAEAAVVRVLLPGEAFSAFEDPRDVSGGECLSMYKVRTLKDGTEGWVTSTMRNEIQPWTTQYKVLKTSPMTSALAANEAAEPVEVMRLLEPGELVDAAEQPVEDGSTGQLRIRCVALQDEVVGFATVREASSGFGAAPLLMRPVTREEAKDQTGAQDLTGGQGAPVTPPDSAAPTTPPMAGGSKGAGRPWQVKEELAEDAGPKGKGKGKGKAAKGKGKGKK
mmetsp:Transcript_121556/g.303297  ORF Transcript_121556/g.303297 Transcript_121556/m.303297 type:complete len:1318 (-) Transcript_121556:50-4003(-)